MRRGCAAIFILIFFASRSSAAIVDLGVLGETYSIAEKDALTEISERAANVDFKIDPKEAEKKIRAYRPKTKKLPKALEDKEYLVDMTHTLDKDVLDKDGQVVYPEGYSYNPLDHISIPKKYVVIDGSDQTQINWFLGSENSGSMYVSLLITDGSCIDLSEQLKRPVFYALEKIVDRFQIKHVPAIVAQQGKFMKVSEIRIKNELKK